MGRARRTGAAAAAAVAHSLQCSRQNRSPAVATQMLLAEDSCNYLWNILLGDKSDNVLFVLAALAGKTADANCWVGSAVFAQ